MKPGIEAIGTLAILIKKELYLPIVGAIFFAETLSVIIQTGYFKYTRKKYGEGRRVFRMAPLHHHYEALGVHESKIVIRFWIVTALLSILALFLFRIRCPPPRSVSRRFCPRRPPRRRRCARPCPARG